MDQQEIDLKLIGKLGILALLVAGVLFSVSYLDTRTVIVFCDVGQGDSAYIRIRNRVDILIDAGPGKAVLGCLGKYMPFYDRTIELAFLSHPQKDHYGGYLYIPSHYRIKQFISSPWAPSSQTLKRLQTILKNKGIPIKPLYRGDSVRIEDALLTSVWPPAEIFIPNLTPSLNPNLLSQMLVFEEAGMKIVFTGDMEDIKPEVFTHSTTILKVPHHGSRRGLTEAFLSLADPRIAVISVGKNNSYGHPSPYVLAMLKSLNIQIKRTDIIGDIVFRF